MLLQYFDYQYITKGLFRYFWKSGKIEQFYHYDHYKNLDCEANNNTRSIAL